MYILHFSKNKPKGYETRGVSNCVWGLAIYIKKGILRQKKKNYGNSNISFTMQKYHLQKILEKKPKSFKIL
jgi:hypothetical protein